MPPQIYIPSDANLINVREHGVKGDGRTDDAPALLQLMRTNLNQHKTLFFPAGTYLLGESIPWTNEKGEFWPWLTWQGEGRERTIIRLRDHAPGFADREKPRALVKTGCYDGEARQSAAFNCYFFDLTLNVGRGNPGAIGLDYCANNNGAVARVDLISEDGAGVTGLSMLRDSPGPALIQHVRVRGFETGIVLGNLLFGMTFEFIALENQSRAGLVVNGNMAAGRKLTSVNRVPAVRLEGWATMVVLIDSELTGGDAQTAAIEAPDAPTLLLRNVTTGGYAHAARGGKDAKAWTVPAGKVSEFLHGSKFALFGEAERAQTLALPVEDAPVFFGGAEDWTRVKVHGAIGDGRADDAPAVQKAMDSGKAVIYFPQGSYRLGSPVIVRGKVRRVIGFSSSFAEARGKTLFRFDGTEQPVALERFEFFDGGKLENAGAQAVTLRHITGPEKRGIVTVGTNRTWFFEDVCTSHFTLPPGTKLYARQFNCEPEPPGEGFVNDGALAWVLGLKSAWGNTIGVTKSGGRTEVLGGLMLAAQGFKNPDAPAFIVEDAQFSG